LAFEITGWILNEGRGGTTNLTGRHNNLARRPTRMVSNSASSEILD